MLTRKLISVSVMVPLVLLALDVVGWSQERRQQGGREASVHVSGKYQSAKGPVLHVLADDGSQYYVRLPQRPENIQYSGTADKSMLKPRMFVQFVGKFDRKGKSVEPVNRVTVFTPSRERSRLGVFPESPAEQSEGDSRQAVIEVANVRVAGQLARFRNNTITVAVGHRTVAAQLADDAEVVLDINDLRFIRPGDTVTVSGQPLPGQRQMIVANRISVVGAQPLGVRAEKASGETGGEAAEGAAAPSPEAALPDPH